MNIKELIEKNKEYNTWKKDIEDLKTKKKQEIEDFNKNLSAKEFLKLDYDEAKEVFEIIKFNLDYKEHRKEIENALKELKERKYSILTKAHYYPIINELDFLSDESKNKLDMVLYKFRNSTIQTLSTLWHSLNFSYEITDKVLNSLYELGLLEKEFLIACDCADGGMYISEERYNYHRKYFELVSKEINKTATEEEIEWINKFEKSGNRIWEVNCFNCESRHINSMEDLDDYLGIIFKNTSMPDTTYADK